MVKSITNSLNPVRSRGPHDHQTYAMCSGGENVAVAVGVGESVGVVDGVGENVAVAVGVGESVGVVDGVGENVGVADGVGESVGVADGVGESVGVVDGVGENVGVADGVGESAGVADGSEQATTNHRIASTRRTLVCFVSLISISSGRRPLTHA